MAGSLGSAVLDLDGDLGPLSGKLSAGKGQAEKWAGETGKSANSIFSTGLGVLGASLVEKGLGALKDGFTDIIQSGKDAGQVQAQLNAVLASTKGVSGMTADSLNALAGSLAKVTPVEDDAIVAGENMLLTFTNIGKDVFPQATSTLLDMATAMAGGAAPSAEALKNQAIQLGKALNDPEKGMTALTRVGVTFTQAQKDSIKAMEAHGNMAGAQAVILKELQTEFGGSAKAAGQTFGGQMQIAQNRVQAFKDDLGMQLLPALQKLMTAGMPLVDNFFSALSNILPGVIDKVAGFAEGAASLTTALVGTFSGDAKAAGDLSLIITDTFGSIGQMFGMTEDQAVNFGMGVSDAFDSVRNTISGLITAFQSGGIGGVITLLGQQITGALPAILAQLSAFAAQATAWITEHWQQILAFLIGGIPGLIIQSLAPMIPGVLVKLGELASQLLAWIGAQAAPLLSRLGEWAQSFVAWIGPAATDFLARWPAILSQFLNWVGTAAGPLLLKLGDWAVAFIGWIIPMIPGFLLTLAKIAAAILIFIAETLIVLVPKIKQWGDEFINFVQKTVIPQLRPKLQAILIEMGKWIIDTAIPWAGIELAKLGQSIVAGISAGIKGAWDGLLKDLMKLLESLPAAVKKFLGISSPSAMFAELGQQTAAGFGVGLSKGMADVTAMSGAAFGALAGQVGSASTTNQGQYAFNITIHAPGGDPFAVAQAVRQGITRLVPNAGGPAANPLMHDLITAGI